MKVMRNSLRSFYCVGLISLVFFTGCATYNAATKRKEIVFLSTNKEISLGEKTHQQLMKEFALSDNKELTSRLELIGSKVSQVSDRQDYAYHFYLIEKDDLNAFTTPGGNVYFFTGLMKSFKSDDEVAAVLAHEIGHCSARHVAKKFEAALGFDVIRKFVFTFLTSTRTKSVADLSANLVMSIVSKAYSRSDEHFADKLAVKYLHLSGYDVNGMVKTLEILKSESKSKGIPAPWLLRTHPYLDDRIKVVQEEIQKLEAK